MAVAYDIRNKSCSTQETLLKKIFNRDHGNNEIQIEPAINYYKKFSFTHLFSLAHPSPNDTIPIRQKPWMFENINGLHEF